MTKTAAATMKKNDEYTSASEFCEMFLNDMPALFQLAFLLTSSTEQAEAVLLAALGDCKRAKVFRPWAASWSKLAVIERALKAMAAGLANSAATNASAAAQPILQLRPLERAVYVLTVLEKYSVRDCAVLMRLSKREVISAQVADLQQVSAAVIGPTVNLEAAVVPLSA